MVLLFAAQWTRGWCSAKGALETAGEEVWQNMCSWRKWSVKNNAAQFLRILGVVDFI